MHSRTRLFDPDILLSIRPKVSGAVRPDTYPLYPKGYKGGESIRSDTASVRRVQYQVLACRNARSFLLGASAHCPQAPPSRLALLAARRGVRYAGRRRRAKPLLTQQSGCSKLKEVYQRSCVYDSCFC